AVQGGRGAVAFGGTVRVVLLLKKPLLRALRHPTEVGGRRARPGFFPRLCDRQRQRHLVPFRIGCAFVSVPSRPDPSESPTGSGLARLWCTWSVSQQHASSCTRG